MAVDIQRGRWTQGHWQIFFSGRNPAWAFFTRKLSFGASLLYNYGGSRVQITKG